MQLFYPAEFGERVRRWGAELELIERGARPTDVVGFYLYYDGRRLQLYRDTDPVGVCLRTDNFAGRVSLSGELARACGVAGGFRPHVVDAMAGLGTDGVTLAKLGCKVTLFERQPTLWALLDDFLAANPTPNTQLRCADSLQWLVAQAGACCDTLYLDPMFPPRSKKALPGKAMQYVRALCEATETALPVEFVETASWLEQAVGWARGRVVLKRRLKGAVIGNPAWQIKGRTVRYDVYRGAG